MKRVTVLWLSLVVTLLIVAAGAYWYLFARTVPTPTYAPDAGVVEVVDGPLPNGTVGTTGVLVEPMAISSDSAELKLWGPQSGVETVTLRIGQSASLGDFTLTLCNTWVNPRMRPPWDTTDGANEYSNRAYFVYSTDGTEPICPE